MVPFCAEFGIRAIHPFAAIQKTLHSPVAALQEPSRGRLVVTARYGRNFPAHRICQTIVNVEQKSDLHGIRNCLLRHPQIQNRPNVLSAKMLVIERHRLQKAQDAAQLLVDRRRCVILENLLDQTVIFERGRRDRGVGIRSKVTLVQPRHESREQLALSNRPFGRSAHNGLGVCGMWRAEEVASIAERSHYVGQPKTRNESDEWEEQRRRQPVAALDISQSHACSSARRPASSRASAAPNAAATIISNN